MEPFLAEALTSGSISFKATLRSRSRTQQELIIQLDYIISNTKYQKYFIKHVSWWDSENVDKNSTGFASLDLDVSKPEGARAL